MAYDPFIEEQLCPDFERRFRPTPVEQRVQYPHAFLQRRRASLEKADQGACSAAVERSFPVTKNRQMKACWLAVGIAAALLLLSPLILRVGYCQSWWGKENLLFRALWLCTCAEEFEQSLYPENVEVLVSACECEDGYRASRASLTVVQGAALVEACEASPAIQDVPGGRLLFVEHYFIDLYTGQRIPFTPPGRIPAWITEDLFWYQKAGGLHLFSMEQQTDLPVVDLFQARPDLLREDKGIDLTQLANELKQKKSVIVAEIIGVAQALVVDVKAGVEEYYYLNDIPFMDSDQGDLVAFLDTYGVPYERFAPSGTYSPIFEWMVTSPSGQWYAKNDEVYQAVNDQKIYDAGITLPRNLIDRYRTGVGASFFPCCWRADERALVLSAGTKTPQIFPSLAFWWIPQFGPIGLVFGVPQPTLLVTLPEEAFNSVP